LSAAQAPYTDLLPDYESAGESVPSYRDPAWSFVGGEGGRSGSKAAASAAPAAPAAGGTTVTLTKDGNSVTRDLTPEQVEHLIAKGWKKG
jgi:hypothetical protein